MSEIISVENELRVELPKQYEDFIAEVGVGEEYGGLAVWLHLDLTQHGNLVEVNKRLWGGGVIPRSMIAVYDSMDGELYGFKRSDRGRLGDRVYVITPSHNGSRPASVSSVAESLVGFLEGLTGCSPEELERARREHALSIEAFSESAHTPVSVGGGRRNPIRALRAILSDLRAL